jgi:hypothetical protein
MVIHPHTKYHWPISKDKHVMARTRKYYLRNNCLTWRSKVKVPRRSLRYATHRLMVMHPHTKYNWPIWSGQASLRRSRRSGRSRRSEEEAEEKIRLKQYVSLRSKIINRQGSKLCLSTSTRDNCCSLKTSWLLHARGMPLSIHDTHLYESSSCTTSLVDTLVGRVASSSGNVGHICLYSEGSPGT